MVPDNNDDDDRFYIELFSALQQTHCNILLACLLAWLRGLLYAHIPSWPGNKKYEKVPIPIY